MKINLITHGTELIITKSFHQLNSNAVHVKVLFLDRSFIGNRTVGYKTIFLLSNSPKIDGGWVPAQYPKEFPDLKFPDGYTYLYNTGLPADQSGIVDFLRTYTCKLVSGKEALKHRILTDYKKL